MQNGLRALNLGGNEMKITCSDFKRNLALEWPPWWMGESQMRCDGVGGKVFREVWGFWGLRGGIEGFFRVGAGTKLATALSLYAAPCRILFTRKRVKKDFINEKKVIFAEEGQTCPPPGPVLSALIIWSKSWLLLLECLRLPSWLSYSTHCSTDSQVPWQLPKKQGREICPNLPGFGDSLPALGTFLPGLEPFVAADPASA